MTATPRPCIRCQQPLGDALFCQYCGTFVIDPDGTIVMAGRGERILAWLLNLVLVIVTLFVGWLIWWFIVAPRGQNPGKAIAGIRVIRTNGDAVRTGGMFVRGLAGQLAGYIPFFLDDLWMLWDKNAQTLHDKIVNSVVVRAQGSEKIVERGGLESRLEPVQAYPSYAPPVSLPTFSPPPPSQPPTASPEDTESALNRLAELRAKNLITEEEYQEKRKAILERM
jgi:uncharacterized RDD family membrane protein YckC